MAVKQSEILRRKNYLLLVKTVQILRVKYLGFIYGEVYLCNRRRRSPESGTAKVLQTHCAATAAKRKGNIAFSPLKQTGLCTFALTVVKETAMMFLQYWMSLCWRGGEKWSGPLLHAQNGQRKPNEPLLLAVIKNFILAEENKILSIKVFLSVPTVLTPSQEIIKICGLHHREPDSTRNCINQSHTLHSESAQGDTCGYFPQKGHSEGHLIALKLFVSFVSFWFIYSAVML